MFHFQNGSVVSAQYGRQAMKNQRFFQGVPTICVSRKTHDKCGISKSVADTTGQSFAVLVDQRSHICRILMACDFRTLLY